VKTSAIEKKLIQNGFFHVKGQLNVKLIDRLRKKAIFCAAQAQIPLKESGPNKILLRKSKIKLTHQEVAEFAIPLIQSQEFQALKKSPELKNALEQVFQKNWRFYEKDHSTYSRITVPNRIAKPMKPHQDSCYLGEGHSIFVIWIPLHDCPLSLGGVSVVPRSHKLEMQDHRNFHGIKIPQSDPRWKRFKFKKGDFVIFHYNIIHGPSANRTKNQSRISVDLRIKTK
jgi:hypothetical protein